jgi:hypothetical protein
MAIHERVASQEAYYSCQACWRKVGICFNIFSHLWVQRWKEQSCLSAHSQAHSRFRASLINVFSSVLELLISICVNQLDWLPAFVKSLVQG